MASYDNAQGVAVKSAAIPAEIMRLQAEADRVQKLAHTLADRLKTVTGPDRPMANDNQVAPLVGVPLATDLMAIRRQISDAADVLVSLNERLEL